MTAPIPLAVVVNDDPTQRRLLAKLLIKQGLEVQAFEGPEEALSAMEDTRPPDLIVTDLYMPGIDGWRFCRLLRSEAYPACNAIPILVVSATFAGQEASRITKELGANAFLSVPVNVGRFKEVVHTLLQGGTPGDLVRVLLVDGSSRFSGLLKTAFEKGGYQADVALNALEAREAFARNSHDVVVMDDHLPDQRGDDLLVEIHGKRPECAIVMMTTDPAPGLALQWIRKGASGYLRKPFEPAYLLELCSRARRERALLRVEGLLEERTRQLLKNEERWKKLIRHSSDILVILDEKGIERYVSDAVEPITGYPPETFVGKLCFDFLHPEDQGPMREAFQRALGRPGVPVRGTYRHRHRNGGWVHLEAIGTNLLNEVDIQGIVLHVRDNTARIEAEQSARMADERIKLLVKNSSDIMVILNADGTQRYVSPAAERITGYGPEELTGRSLAEIIHPDDLPRLLAVWNEAVEHPNRVVKVEYRHIHKSGGWVHLEAVGQNFLEDPVVNGVISSVRDISERRQAEKELRESEGRLNLALKVAEMGYWRYDCATSEVQWSGGHHLLFGISMEEFGGTLDAVQACVHPDDQEMGDLNLRKALEQDIPFDNTYRVVHPNGHIHWLYSHGLVYRDDQCRPDHIFGITQDITERKKAEEALRAAEETYRNLFLNSQIGLFRTDLKTGIVLDANDAVARFAGFKDRSEMLAAPFYIQERYVDQKEGGQVVSLLKAHGEVRNREVLFRRNDGSTIWIRYSARLIREKGWVEGVSEDITEMKRLDEERARLEAQFHQAQKMESVGRLAGGVAHDFNNMLSVILGHTEMGLMKVSPHEPMHRRLLQIQETARRSADLVRQLLAFARKQTIEPRVLDLNDTIGGMLKMLRRMIGENIHLLWMPGPSLWSVRMDPSQLDQILANLCVNARDAISDVGKVAIHTENLIVDPTNQAEHGDVAPGAYVLLSISDDGCGMSREVIDNLFEPFFTTKEMGKGTGLGLATVYGIIRQNNGFIGVKTEWGQGTTFHVYLPRHEGGEGLLDQEGPDAPLLRGSETVLLVEDEPMLLEIGQSMLEALGYRVLAANTPNRALKVAEGNAIDLLISDVVMPDMNGRELARRLQSLHPGLQSMFMSGYTSDIIGHKGVLDPGVHFIQKPFSIGDLAGKIRQALDRGKG